jgi:hypothetical protein
LGRKQGFALATVSLHTIVSSNQGKSEIKQKRGKRKKVKDFKSKK